MLIIIVALVLVAGLFVYQNAATKALVVKEVQLALAEVKRAEAAVVKDVAVVKTKFKKTPKV